MIRKKFFKKILWQLGLQPQVSPSNSHRQVYPSVPSSSSSSPSPSASPLDTDVCDTGVQLYLDLSTGHVSYEDWLKMKEWNEDSPVRVRHHWCGLIMWIFVDCEYYNELPESVKLVVIYAKANGCWLINFDQDGQIINGLDYYDW